MSPTLEEALSKLQADEIEAGQQILIKILNEDPRNDDAWKHLIESYTDLELQIQLANEYFNLTAGCLKATQTLLRYTRLKNERYARQQEDELSGLGKLKGYIKWKKSFLVKVILGLAALLIISNLILLGTNIGASVRSAGVRTDFNRLSGVYSDLLLANSQLETKYSQLEAQHTELLATYQQLVVDYKALVEGATNP